MVIFLFIHLHICLFVETDTYPSEAFPHYHLYPFVKELPQLDPRGFPSIAVFGCNNNLSSP